MKTVSFDILVEATDMPWATERRVREWGPHGFNFFYLQTLPQAHLRT